MSVLNIRLAKIESQIRWVSDCELLCLADALGVSVSSLLPAHDQAKHIMRHFFEAFH
jgi:hypothetical protein